MAHSVFFTSSLFVFTLCIGYGDGRWKKKDKDGFYQDIDVFKKMAEKLERDIEELYQDYPEEPIKKNDIEKMLQHENIKNIHGYKTRTTNLIQVEATTQTFASTTHVDKTTQKSMWDVVKSAPTYVTFRSNKALRPNWPKFEDILLETGKKYDWKNDRWIKVKRKTKPPKKVLRYNSINSLVKRRFAYKGIKLNRKSRRNVVIAVTAVR